MSGGACAKAWLVSGWPFVALSALGYALDVVHLYPDGRHAELVAGAAAALALLLYWRLVVQPRLTRRNRRLLLGPFLVVAVGSLAVALASSSHVAVDASWLACGLHGLSSGSLLRREHTPGRQ